MLIRAIRAENFMRFSHLGVEALPPQGVIGIEGPNETGKTTLGEILLFALFGQTRLLVNAPVATLIRWGAESMRVEVEFSIRSAGDGGGWKGEAGEGPADGGNPGPSGDFLIYRQVDRSGSHHVKVIRLPERTEVAAGNIHVAEFLARSIRFDAVEFQRSFYHDQYEVRKVETAQVAFFESATGVRHLLDAGDLIQKELDPLEREFSYYQKEVARNRLQIEKYDRNVVKLVELTDRRGSLEETLEEKKGAIPGLKARMDILRRELCAVDARSERAGRLVDLPVDDVCGRVEDIRIDEEKSIRTRDELGEESLRVSSRSILASLEKLEGLARGLRDLRRRIADERKVLRVQDEAAASGMDDLRDRCLRERRRVLRRLIGCLPTFLVVSWAAVWLLHFTVVLGAAPDFADAYGLPASWPDSLRGSGPAWLGGVAGLGLAILTLQVWSVLRSSSRRRRLLDDAAALSAERSRLGAEASRLEALDPRTALRDLPATLDAALECGNARVAAAASSFREEHGALLGEEEIGALGASVVSGFGALRSSISAEIPRTERRVQEEEAARRKLQGELSRLESEVRECQSQAAKKEALEEKNRELEASAAAIRDDIEARRLAVALLEETALGLRTRLGPTLTRFVKGALPRLTAGRYRDVRVEEDLAVKVYSSDKNDFLSIHELSGGTNEALSLALRLAISQALVAARTRQAQFVLLDEPFKMMDGERAVETLSVLRTLSPDLRQFFVIQPRFTERERELCSCLVLTSREGTDLEVRCR